MPAIIITTRMEEGLGKAPLITPGVAGSRLLEEQRSQTSVSLRGGFFFL